MRNFLRSALGRRRSGSTVVLSTLRVDEFRALLPEVIGIWARAMNYPSSFIAPRISLAENHLRERDLRVFLAHDPDGTLLGFAYGYASRTGQWWHDEVTRLARHADATQLLRWLPDCYELCELHVDPTAQGHGIGRSLLGMFIEQAPARRVLLSTPEAPTTAVRLYESSGFSKLGSGFKFAGDLRPFAIYGRERVPADYP